MATEQLLLIGPSNRQHVPSSHTPFPHQPVKKNITTEKVLSDLAYYAQTLPCAVIVTQVGRQFESLSCPPCAGVQMKSQFSSERLTTTRKI